MRQVDHLALPEEQARRVAKMVDGFVADVLDELEQKGLPAGAGPEDPELAMLQQEDLERLQGQERLIRPVMRQLTDIKFLTAILTGRKRLTGRLRPAMEMILHQLVSRTADLLGDNRRQIEPAFRHIGQHLDCLAANPQGLMLLQTYEQRIQRSIDRKLRQVGSFVQKRRAGRDLDLVEGH